MQKSERFVFFGHEATVFLTAAAVFLHSDMYVWCFYQLYALSSMSPKNSNA
jgi:hypothetical protein